MSPQLLCVFALLCLAAVSVQGRNDGSYDFGSNGSSLNELTNRSKETDGFRQDFPPYDWTSHPKEIGGLRQDVPPYFLCSDLVKEHGKNWDVLLVMFRGRHEVICLNEKISKIIGNDTFEIFPLSKLSMTKVEADSILNSASDNELKMWSGEHNHSVLASIALMLRQNEALGLRAVEFNGVNKIENGMVLYGSFKPKPTVQDLITMVHSPLRFKKVSFCGDSKIDCYWLPPSPPSYFCFDVLRVIQIGDNCH